MARRVREISEPRNSHVVVNIDRTRRVRWDDETQPAPPVIYDQEAETDRRRSDDLHTITRIEAGMIAGLLVEARQRRLKPADRRIDEALALLGAHPSHLGPKEGA